MRKLICLLIAEIIVGCYAFALGQEASDRVVGNLILVNDNAGWCWYQDERIVYDKNASSILTSTVANKLGYDGTARNADIDATEFNLATGERTRVVMGNVPYEPNGRGDDHNAGALWIRPDGRYLHMYTGHNLSSRRTFYRVSTNPHDASTWDKEQSYHWPTIGNPDSEGNATYSNLLYLSKEGTKGQGRLYNICRESQRSPSFAYSDDLGATWKYGGKLSLTKTASSYSNGYYKFSGNNVDRIDFIATEHHPRDYNTSIYHGYIKDGKSYDSFGRMIDDNIFDEKAPAPEDFTAVFKSEDVGPSSYHHAWTIEIERDSQDNLYALFTTRYGTAEAPLHAGAAGSNQGNVDHRLFYARFDGKAWHTTELAHMGHGLWHHEQDYTGLGAIHPDNPNLIYVSTPYDPRDNRELTHHEIFKGVSSDHGKTWQWTQITSKSTVDNLRPAIPRWDADHTAVFWVRGVYRAQDNFDQALVGLIDIPEESVGPVSYTNMDSANANTADTTASGVLKAATSELPAGTYDVFAYFWSPPAEDWRLAAGFDPAKLLVFRRQSCAQADAGQFSNPVKVSDGRRALYQAYVERKLVGGDAKIDVYIGTAAGKTAYDGIGVARVNTPHK
jgi:hypothetical protein